MDDHKVLIQSDGDFEEFALAVKLAFGHTKTVSHFFETDKEGLLFCWHEDKSVNTQALPCKLDPEAAAKLAWDWMKQYPKEKREGTSCLGDDGSTSPKGWRVDAYRYPFMGNSHYVTFAVKPLWATYHK